MTNSATSTNSVPRYRLTRTGMTRPEMVADATHRACGSDELPEGVSLVELDEAGDTVDAGFGALTCFVLSDDADYLAEALPEGLLPTGANYVRHQGMYARIDENPDYHA